MFDIVDIGSKYVSDNVSVSESIALSSMVHQERYFFENIDLFMKVRSHLQFSGFDLDSDYLNYLLGQIY
jgi:hypothetical protein